MSCRFYDLLKYAKTGVAAHSMTQFDMMWSLAMSGFAHRTLTGVPPISFMGNGKPLVSWSMLGNGSQTGTPSPDNIIMPDFCGVRTGQLFYARLASKNVAPNGYISNVSGYDVLIAKVSPAQEYTASKCNGVYGFFDRPPLDGSVQSIDETRHTFSGDTTTFTAPAGCYYVAVRCKSDEEKPMLNTGSTALPYEPYGWAEKITCAGQTTPMYLGQVQTVRRVKKLEVHIDRIVNLASGYVGAVTSTFTQYANYSAKGFCDIFSYGGTSVVNSFYINQVNAVFVLDAGTTLEDARELLNGHFIWYVLAEPETGIVNEPLAKIGDYADELHSAIPIPTVKGQNLLTVDTDLQPSSVSITGNIAEAH